MFDYNCLKKTRVNSLIVSILDSARYRITVIREQHVDEPIRFAE